MASATAVMNRLSADCPRCRPEREHHDHGEQRRSADPQGQLVELDRQRRLLLFRAGQHPGDLADLGVRTDRGDQHDPAAVGDRGVHERHVGLVAGTQIRVGERRRLLGRRSALAGERGLVDIEGHRMDHPAVRCNVVAGGEQDQIADNHLLGRDRRLHPVPANPGGALGERLQRVHRAFRLALLAKAHHGVEHGQQQQGGSRAPLPDRQRQHAGDHQDDLHVGRVLGQEPLPARRLLLGWQSIRAVLGEPLGGRRGGQPGGFVHTEPVGHLVGRHRVPPDGPGPGRRCRGSGRRYGLSCHRGPSDRRRLSTSRGPSEGAGRVRRSPGPAAALAA